MIDTTQPSETVQILQPPQATVIFDSTLGFPGEGPPASWEMAVKGKRKTTTTVRSTTPTPVPAFQGWTLGGEPDAATAPKSAGVLFVP